MAASRTMGSCQGFPAATYRTRLVLTTLLSLNLLQLGIFRLSAMAEDTNPTKSTTPSCTSARKPRLIPGLEIPEEDVSIAVGLGRDQPITQAPSNVYVLTEEDIRHSGAVDLPTVLRRIPGMEVIQMTAADFNVSTRGGNQIQANKLLVLIDGRSVYIDANAFMFWRGFPITLPEIKRIEVLKGPASSVYGFNAVDGIINIITKSPEEMKGCTIQIGGGEYGTISSAAVVAGAVDKFGYRLSYGHDRSNSWNDRHTLAFAADRVHGQFEYSLPDRSKLKLSGGFVNMDPFDGTVQRNISLSSTVKLPDVYLGYERSDSFIRFWWNQFDAKSLTITNPAISNLLRTTTITNDPRLTFLGNSYNVDGQHGVDLWSGNRLTVGLNYRLNTFSGNSVTGRNNENRLGFYLEDEWKLTEKVTLVAGARYDLDTFIHPQLSPRAAILFSPITDHTFRASVSVAYRTPSLFETHENLQVSVFPFPPLRPPIPITGSSSLNPEEMISYQLGYQGWYLKHRLRTRVDLFFNHVSNLIDLQQVSPTLITNANSPGVADIYGGEAGFEFMAATWLTTFANVAYQDFGQSLTGTYRRGGPKYKVNAGARGDWPNGLSGEVVYHYVGSATYPIGDFFSQFAAAGVIPPSSVPNTRVPAYGLLNVRIGYWIWKDKAEVAFSAFNALNDKHNEHPLGEIIGSRVMGWLTIML
jgi:iron complex outermembrane recepter protein